MVSCEKRSYEYIKMKKKVLFFVESLSGGGAEKVLAVLLKYLNYEKYNITLVSLVDTGIYLEDVKKNNILYRSILGRDNRKGLFKFKYKLFYKLIYKILSPQVVYKYFLQNNFDIEIAFLEGYCTKILSNSTNKKAIKIAWVHTDLLNNNWTIKQGIYTDIKEEKKAYSKFEHVICVSDSVKNIMVNYYRLSNCVRIYNPIDQKDIMCKSKCSIDFHLNSNAFNIISVGRLVPEKGFDRLIAVFGKIRNEIDKEICLYILGEGSEFQSLTNLIIQYNLEKNVKLLGFKENPYAYIGKMDLFVCSSRSEGYSLVIAESMVLGIPIVSTNCSGPNELLNYNEYGLLCDNSELGLRDAIKKMIFDDDVYHKYKLLSAERGRLFVIDKIINKVETILDSSK